MASERTGIERIAAERKRQIEVEGWTPEHDNLSFIVRTALDWEEHLGKRNQR